MNTTFIKYSEECPENIIAWKILLNKLSVEHIHQQIEDYKAYCHNHSASFKLIKDKVNSLFVVEYQNQKFPLHFKYLIEPEKRHPDCSYYFFRVRKMDKGVYWGGEERCNYEKLEFGNIQTLDDVWEKPANLVTSFQRLNMPQNSVLYTSLMPSTAILETGISAKDIFFLIIYKATNNTFKYSDCSRFIYINELTEEENLKRYIIFNILREEFIRILPTSYKEQNQYCAAYYIAKRFFIHDNVDAIQYPSVRGLNHMNFAFFENHIKSNLELVGIRICGLAEQKGMSAKIAIIADGFWNGELNKMDYYSPYSDKSKRIFTEYLNILMSK